MGVAGCCLPGCQPAFLGRSNTYCWSSQVGCSWSGASEDAPESTIKTSHKVVGLLNSDMTWVPRLISYLCYLSLGYVNEFSSGKVLWGNRLIVKGRKETLAQSWEVELGPEKLPPTSLPRPFSSELLCPTHTIPAAQPDVRVGCQTAYLKADTQRLKP